MSGELLAIVHAEERATAIVEDAEKRKQRSLERALHEREKHLKAIHPLKPHSVYVDTSPPDTERIARVAKKNMNATVKHILEALHAS